MSKLPAVILYIAVESLLSAHVGDESVTRVYIYFAVEWLLSAHVEEEFLTLTLMNEA